MKICNKRSCGIMDRKKNYVIYYLDRFYNNCPVNIYLPLPAYTVQRYKQFAYYVSLRQNNKLKITTYI